MVAKVRIKAGPVEFEYEGETELAVTDIKDLFSHIETLFKVPILAEGGETHTPVEPAPPVISGNASSGGGKKLHVNSVAQTLKAKSGSEVALAAAATLQICEGKQTFSRTELLDTMKKATMHYNANMSSNLTKILGTLVGSKFNQIGDGVYSLKSEEHQKLAAALA
ncbi:hypothetical protein [Sphingobium sp. SYK-6]|uniref:hypothetical protein n=1 Tax=Sphingobium sp. (strain NBRC 103272 / SYK-6) TaxID=627192 RepID=UPI0011D262EE|nr:hypothetical protein [Sphingobium sp. SYK-6]